MTKHIFTIRYTVNNHPATPWQVFDSYNAMLLSICKNAWHYAHTTTIAKDSTFTRLYDLLTHDGEVLRQKYIHPLGDTIVFEVVHNRVRIKEPPEMRITKYARQTIATGLIFLTITTTSCMDQATYRTNAHLVSLENGIATFQTEDGNLWEAGCKSELPQSRCGDYELRFFKNGTSEITDDKIIGIKGVK